MRGSTGATKIGGEDGTRRQCIPERAGRDLLHPAEARLEYNLTVMLNRREFGLSAAALLGACGANEQEDAEQTAEPSGGPLYFDLHIDTPSRMVAEGLNLAESPEYSQVDIPKMREGGFHAGFFAVFSSARNKTPLESVKDALKITDVIVEEVKRHPDDLFLATTSDDVLRAQRESRMGVLIGVEGGHMIDSSIEVLRQLYRLGARYLGLTHSGNTPWVGAAEYDDGPEGLTEDGKNIVREMNRLGMMADLSHASDRAYFDTIEVSSAPILNTHAACRSVANHPRNLTDERFHNTGIGYEDGQFVDDGRFLVTGRPRDRGAFKTPTLRDVALTAPYMHDGSLTTLERVIDDYDRGGTPNPYLDPEIRKLNLSDGEKDALAAFLRTLNGAIQEGLAAPASDEPLARDGP